MAATNRPAAPRRAPAKPKALPAPVPDDDGDIIAGDALSITTAPQPPGRRVVIFYIDGHPYSVPESPPARITINYADEIRRNGPLVATTYLLDAMLGTEGWGALRSREDITDEQLAQVVSKVIAQLSPAPKG